MHFAYPPRKNSNPPPYRPRSTRLPLLRKSRIRTLALVLLGGLLVLFLAKTVLGGKGESQPSGNPPVVIVTVLDVAASGKNYIQNIRENRIKYAEKHGYETFFAKTRDYDLKGAPTSWAKVVAMRHALTKFPNCKYIWFLAQDSYIMNPMLTIEDHLMRQSKLESLMIRDYPVVPPDSIIKTFPHLKAGDVELVLSQDKEGLSSDSLVLRNGEWAKFFLETWNEPLYRSYNFQKAESHALEHVVQWHPTIMSKLALIPQRVINAYSKSATGEQYQDGDFVVRFPDCRRQGGDTCEQVAEPFLQKWHTAFENA